MTHAKVSLIDAAVPDAFWVEGQSDVHGDGAGVAFAGHPSLPSTHLNSRGPCDASFAAARCR